jgi:(1->4)-alpha-D-glucan 1-alpha-D-glucosylmutase
LQRELATVLQDGAVELDTGALNRLVSRQAWRIAHWRVAGSEINVRRFFDVNALAALRAERAEVFEDSHRLVLRWLRETRVHGLRIDHADGLADPLAYFVRLQRRHAACTGRAVYLVVEKILAEEETLPVSWPAHGDTGYGVASDLVALFVNTRHEQAFDRLVAAFTGEALDFDTLVHEAKRHIIEVSLQADLEGLAERAWHLSRAGHDGRDLSRAMLREAIAALAAGHTVYRTYLDGRKPDETDRARLAEAAAAAKRRLRPSLAPAIDWLQHTMLAAREGDEALAFVHRFQQFCAPVMAKAVEDTVLYRYNRLVCLNDVGADARRFGLPVAAFHARNCERARRAPHALSASSTHDSKRSEDVRARLAVLSEMPVQWQAAIARWRDAIGPTQVDATDLYLLYQTLVGVWPLGDVGPGELVALRQRVAACMLKAVREAKRRTSWTEPDVAYEEALAGLIEQLFADGEFVHDLRCFVAPLAIVGACNSLGLVACKLTAPGVPDIYQGNEAWQFSLVDPDNRRRPDFERLGGALEQLDRPVAELRASLPDGRLKLLVTARVLQWRARHAALFAHGEYTALRCFGGEAAHAVAFARGQGGCITLCGRLLWQLARGEPQALFEGGRCWGDTVAELPPAAPVHWRDLVSGREIRARDGALPLADALHELPVAVLTPAGAPGVPR